MAEHTAVDVVTAHAGIHLAAWPATELAARVQEAMGIYALAMNYSAQTGAQRGVTTRWHTAHEGFACWAALDDDDTLVGFGYGYTTQPGQWWHDLVRKALEPEDADWLVHAFELSEMHVLPKYQGVGIGRTLLTALAADIPHRSILLSTPDLDTRAFRLYRNLGFVDLARKYLFPGDTRPFAVLGARLPLDEARRRDTAPPGTDARRPCE
jgi:ribosomal protein S18 acetylase RimI-like enzyme